MLKIKLEKGGKRGPTGKPHRSTMSCPSRGQPNCRKSVFLNAMIYVGVKIEAKNAW